MKPVEVKDQNIYILGTIITKNQFPGKDNKPDRFSIDVAVPGNKQLFSVSIKPEVWGALAPMTEFFSAVRVRLYNEQLYLDGI
jgi:hypothetical protein